MKPRITIPDLQDSGRRAYRLEVTPEDPIQVHIDDQAIEVRNLSATGMAFVRHHPLVDTTVAAHIAFTLNMRSVRMDCNLKLVRKVGQVWCADFEGLSLMEQKLLSQFITQCQASAIRKDARS